MSRRRTSLVELQQTRHALSVRTGGGELKLSLRCPGQGSIEFGPLRRGAAGYVSPTFWPWRVLGVRPRYDFVDGPITVVDAAGSTQTLDGRNGIEALALAHFRDDLRQLVQRGHGVVRFGDHDFSDLVELEVVRERVVRVTANLPSLDLWEVPVGEVSLDALVAVVEQIDRIEAAFGRLHGYCHGCGTPSPTYEPKPLVA